MPECGEFDLYVPVTRGDGKKYSARLLAGYKQEIIQAFGGITDFKHRSAGEWRIGPVTFHDQIMLWRVLSMDTRQGRRFFRELKKRMEHELQQETVLIVERAVRILK